MTTAMSTLAACELVRGPQKADGIDAVTFGRLMVALADGPAGRWPPCLTRQDTSAKEGGAVGAVVRVADRWVSPMAVRPLPS